MSRRGRIVVRATLLAAASLAVFGSVYVLTSIVLPDPSLAEKQVRGADRLPLPGVASVNDGIGPSEEVTFRIFDAKTNRPTADVDIGSYRRTGETTVELADVTVRLLAQGDATVVITSPGGTIRVDPPAAGRQRQVDAEAIAAADQARLSDVTIRWFDRSPSDDAAMVLSLDNVLFDSSRMTIQTGDTTIDGRTVLAADVPVIVRGNDLDFDGKGLQIDWDPVARRPSMLRIAGGGTATIKTRPDFLPDGFLPGDEVAVGMPSEPTGVLLADASGSLPAGAVDESPRATPYLFSVAGPLRGVQGEVVLLDAADAAGVLPLSERRDSEPSAPPTRKAEQRSSGGSTRSGDELGGTKSDFRADRAVVAWPFGVQNGSGCRTGVADGREASSDDERRGARSDASNKCRHRSGERHAVRRGRRSFDADGRGERAGDVASIRRRQAGRAAC